MLRITEKEYRKIGQPTKAARKTVGKAKAQFPALTEAAVAKQINGYLEAKGWVCNRTPSDKVQTAAGHWDRFYPIGHADWICTRAVEPGAVDMFYREDKGQLKRTERGHRLEQRAWAEMMTKKGYFVWTCPENCADPLATFVKWYEENWPI